MQYKALHSPSCCFFNDSLYVAFYAGEAECVSQSVFIYKKEKSGKLKFYKKLPEGTGNPALFVYRNELYCTYSVFTRPMTGNVFDLWQTTYTSIINLSKSTEEKNATMLLGTYSCPRTNPISLSNGSTIIPCYDEQIHKGVFYSIGNGSYIERSVAMSDHAVIQPSVFTHQGGLYAIFRNFKRNRTEEESFSPFCRIGYTPQQRLIFSQTSYTKIPNNNESVVAINDDSGNVISVYNATKGRKDLTVAFLHFEDNTFVPEPLLKINLEEQASYPNCCYNKTGQLVVCYTSYSRGINSGSRIAVATLSKKYSKIISTKYIDFDMLNNLEGI